jgi:hypothetical protein
VSAARHRLRIRHHRRLALAALILLLTMAPLGWRLFGPDGTPVELLRKTWRSELEIERLVEVLDSSWCDAMPANAELVSRTMMVDPRGQRAEPAAHCRYRDAAWRRVNGLLLEGGADTPPAWPQPRLRELPPGQLGAERPGKRERFFEIELQAGSGERWTCRLRQAHWQTLHEGMRFRLKVDRHRVANCASVPMSP